MRMGLSMSSIDFVTRVLERIVREEKRYSSMDFVNFAKVINDLPPDARLLVKVLSESPEHCCCNLLTCLIDDRVTIAAEKFLKSAARLPDAKVEFQRSRLEKKNVFVVSWMVQHGSLGVENQLPRKRFYHLGFFLYNILFIEWTHLAIDNEMSRTCYLCR